MDETRANNLYDAGFHSLDALKNANIVELMEIDYISPTTARKIKQYIQEPIEVSDFEFLEESLEDREKFAMKFGEHPGRLLLKFRHSKLLRSLPSIMIIVYLVCIGISTLILISAFPFFTVITFAIIFPISILFIVVGLIERHYWNLDFIRIYEQGILLSRRKEGVHSKAPVTYWSFVLFPIWQAKFGYRYILKNDVVKIYPIYANNRFVGMNIIDTHGRWISSNFMFILKDYKNRCDEILETLEIIFGSNWKTICANAVEFRIPWGFDFKPE